jgi:DNA-directed RNA polymerase subunit omega
MISRIPVNECLQRVSNRFALAMIAAKRMEQLMNGGQPRVASEKGKLIRTVFDEISQGLVEFSTAESKPAEPAPET